MENTVQITVIIPIYNSHSIIKGCLESLADQTMGRQQYEVIVVDDGSTDGTVGYIQENFPWVRIVPIPHGGPSAARNAGALAARGDLILFTDSDCIPERDWIERMVEPFSDPAVVGVKGVYRTGQPQVIARFMQLEYQYKYERMAKLKWLDFVDTYSAAYRRVIFLHNGGFDVSFTVPSVEDQELSFRLAQKGYKLSFAQHAIVYHVHDRSVGEYWKRKFGIGYWKAYLLQWMPQKTFNDSHTSPSQRWQIGFLALGLLFLVAGIFLPWALQAAAACALAFLISSLRFIWYALRRDLLIGLLSPFLLMVRAAALGTGLVKGFVAPPRHMQGKVHSLSMGAFFLKRTLDIVGSLVGIVIGTPIVAGAALAIRLDSPGPVLFIQERAGEDGKPFKVIKLRTMVDGADEMTSAELEADKRLGRKPKHDSRITKVGAFLRRSSMDEIPQFVNVLRGEMSLVGPRPEEMKVVANYTDRQRLRLAVKPGITGPMQVNGRGELDIDQRLELELDYIHNYTIWKDIQILIKTVGVVLTGKGAF